MATMKLQKEFKKLEEALGKANQSISQLNMTGSIAIELEDANQSIQFAITQLQALKLTFSEVLLTLPRGTQQQVNQLSQQISQASQTLQLIQASIPALLP